MSGTEPVRVFEIAVADWVALVEARAVELAAARADDIEALDAFLPEG